MLDTNERRRRRDAPGTTVYLLDLDPDAVRVLTQRKVVDYLRRRRGPALARGDYTITVEEGRSVELVTPEEPDGIRVPIPPQQTLWGRVEFGLYVAARPDRHRRVAVVGRAGTTIIDDLAELDEFDHPPWTSDQVSGTVAFEALQSSSGRRAVLRDRSAFPLFVSAVSGVEPLVSTTLQRVARAVDEEQAERLADIVRRVFSRVLKELADLDNPMRTPLGGTEGDGGLLSPAASATANGSGPSSAAQGASSELPELPALPEPPEEPPEPLDVEAARPERGRSRALPTVAPDPAPGEARSRFEPDAGVVLYNDTHADYLLVKDDEAPLLDYLATLVAKEYVVYNNPRARPDELAEEMVRMLVRVRRHMARRR